MALYLNILTAVLLALVAGLLLMVSFQLRTWRSSNAQAPLLAEKLTEAILSARKGLGDLKSELVAQGPEISRLTTEASKMRVELQFLIQRGEQMANRLEGDTSRSVSASRAVDDEDEEMPMVRLAPSTQAVVEQVSVANGLAAKPVQQVQNQDGDDPLETLLANLQGEGGADTIKKSPKRKRVGPVTQAELDLQQSLKDVA
ncbi:MAG: hypothetical protein EON60_00825 [Alphaproteobacteria bacterium]|nr:MAG: hypothetical protein EON60_00825 [Alphaproteobacteria bacterium]